MSTTAVELGTVLDFFNGKAPPNDEDGDFVVYGSNGTIGKAKSTNHENAIILGRVGAYCGSVEFCDEKFWASDNTIVVKTKDGFDLKYMYYRLKSFPLRSYAGGAAQPLLTQTILRGVRLPVVKDKNRQVKIASILSAYDDLIENNRQRIQLLEQAARLLYKEWFVHLRFPGHEHAKIINGVPEGWEKKRLEEIADITMGQSPASIYYNEAGNGLPFHQGVTNFGDRFPSHRVYCTVQNRLAEPGDILFSVRAPVGRINITLDKIVIGRGLAAIRSICGQQNLLFYTLKNHFFKEDMIGGGAIFAAITKKDLHNVELLQSQNQVAEMFMEHVRPIDRQIENLTQEIERLNRARDLLLPRLMNGEIAV